MFYPEILKQTGDDGTVNQQAGQRVPAALITGGRRGLGRGIAWAMAESGFDILLADLERDAAAEEFSPALDNEAGAPCSPGPILPTLPATRR